MDKKKTSKYSGSSPYVFAMILGTALSASAAYGKPVEGTLQALNDMGRYCTTCWRNARLPIDQWMDCTQEVFTKMLERVPQHAWTRALSAEGEERKEFLRAIDAVKKRTQRAKKYSGDVEMAADQRDLTAQEKAEELELVTRASREILSERQQKIVQLSLDGWSVHEMAEELNLPAERVSDEKYKAIRKLREHLGGA